jgi:hypothetical protein
VAALQHGRYIGYGHLYFSSVDGRDKNVWLVAVITQMHIKLFDQALICSGGDGLKKPLQTLVLQLLNYPTCSFIIGELLFEKVFSNKSLRLSMGRLATMPRVPEDREDDPWPLGILEVGWGFLLST